MSLRYKFCNLLYKLNIINRYSYTTSNNSILKNLEESDVMNTNIFSLQISYNIEEDRFIDIDYFYRMKKGNKKIILVNKDTEIIRYVVNSVPKNINVIIGDKYYNIDGSPKIKAVYKPPFEFDKDIEDAFNIRTITEVYDFSAIKRLRKRSIINVNNINELKKEEIDHIRVESRREFRNLLDRYTLSDFIEGCFDSKK